MLRFIDLFGRSIPLYGICMATGILCASFLAAYSAKRYGLDVNSLIAIMAFAVGFGLIGAKVFYIVTVTGIGNFFAAISRGDFSDLVGSGLVYYGGLLFGILGAYVGTRATHERVDDVCTAVVPAVPLGHAFGRLGCFCAGCCYGIPYDGPGSVVFPDLAPQAVVPVQLIEMACNLFLSASLLLLRKKGFASGKGLLFLYLALYGGVRFLLEFLRGDVVRGIWGIFSTSQWLSLALMLASFAYLLVARRRSEEKLHGKR